jgi:hypothetical protein
VYLANNLALAADLAGALKADQAVELNRALTTALGRTARWRFDRIRGLDQELDPLLERAQSLRRAHQRSVARSNDLYTTRRSARDLDPSLSRDLMRDYVSTRDVAVLLVSGLEGVLDSKRDRGRSSMLVAHELAGELVTGLNWNFGQWLSMIPVDVSGTDLSRLDLAEPEVLAGTVWSDKTVWPPTLAAYVREQSDLVRQGVYRVRVSARDKSGRR